MTENTKSKYCSQDNSFLHEFGIRLGCWNRDPSSFMLLLFSVWLLFQGPFIVYNGCCSSSHLAIYYWQCWLFKRKQIKTQIPQSLETAVHTGQHTNLSLAKRKPFTLSPPSDDATGTFHFWILLRKNWGNVLCVQSIQPFANYLYAWYLICSSLCSERKDSQVW